MMYYTYNSIIEGVETGFVRRDDGALVSIESQEYISWLEEGNVPEEWNPDAN